MNRMELIERWLPRGASPVASDEHFAPSNIALCKYWGKRDSELNLPVNASLSVSLGTLGSRTRVEPIEGPEDEVWLNGQRQLPDSRFARRVSAFIDLFRVHQGDLHFRVRTENNIPTAAGWLHPPPVLPPWPVPWIRLLHWSWRPGSCRFSPVWAAAALAAPCLTALWSGRWGYAMMAWTATACPWPCAGPVSVSVW